MIIRSEVLIRYQNGSMGLITKQRLVFKRNKEFHRKITCLQICKAIDSRTYVLV